MEPDWVMEDALVGSMKEGSILLSWLWRGYGGFESRLKSFTF